jgi:hypothetical protein
LDEKSNRECTHASQSAAISISKLLDPYLYLFRYRCLGLGLARHWPPAARGRPLIGRTRSNRVAKYNNDLHVLLFDMFPQVS